MVQRTIASNLNWRWNTPIGIVLLIGIPVVALAQIEITLSQHRANPGSIVEVTATLTSTGEENVAGIELDLETDSDIAIVRRNDGTPECEVNEAIQKGASGFGWRTLRSRDGRSALLGVHAIIAATDNVEAIPVSTEIFRCRLRVEGNALAGAYPILGLRARYAPPHGGDRKARISDGLIVVNAVPVRTPTSTGTPPPGASRGGSGCNITHEDAGTQMLVLSSAVLAVLALRRGCPRRLAALIAMMVLTALGPPAFAIVVVDIGEAVGSRGESLRIPVLLRTDGEAVSGVQFTIRYDPTKIAIASRLDGRPDCQVSDALNKPATGFGFRPRGCGRTSFRCEAVSAVVLAFDNVDPIPSGAELFSCSVAVAHDAADGLHLLHADTARYALPEGSDIPADMESGGIFVSLPSTPSPTRTFTEPTPTVRQATPPPTQTVGRPTPTANPRDPADTNCDSSLDSRDLDAAIRTVFGDGTSCSADCNGDHRITASDLRCVASRLTFEPAN